MAKKLEILENWQHNILLDAAFEAFQKEMTDDPNIMMETFLKLVEEKEKMSNREYRASFGV